MHSSSFLHRLFQQQIHGFAQRINQTVLPDIAVLRRLDHTVLNGSHALYHLVSLGHVSSLPVSVDDDGVAFEKCHRNQILLPALQVSFVLLIHVTKPFPSHTGQGISFFILPPPAALAAASSGGRQPSFFVPRSIR
jgi:hypothetical protein